MTELMKWASTRLDAAARYARGQIDVARATPGRGRHHPAGQPEQAGDRRAPPGRRRTHVRRDRRGAVHLAAEHHVQNIYTKIGVSNRAAATRWAVTHRVVQGVLGGVSSVAGVAGQRSPGEGARPQPLVPRNATMPRTGAHISA